MRQVIDAVNAAFERAYPGVTPTDDPDVLVKRIQMLSDDLDCTRVNWTTIEKAYNALDAKHRGIRKHWWQFWRRHVI